jgi:hypothetical protein
MSKILALPFLWYVPVNANGPLATRDDVSTQRFVPWDGVGNVADGWKREGLRDVIAQGPTRDY